MAATTATCGCFSRYPLVSSNMAGWKIRLELEALIGKSHKYCIFQHAMFDYRRVFGTNQIALRFMIGDCFRCDCSMWSILKKVSNIHQLILFNVPNPTDTSFVGCIESISALMEFIIIGFTPLQGV